MGGAQRLSAKVSEAATRLTGGATTSLPTSFGADRLWSGLRGAVSFALAMSLDDSRESHQVVSRSLAGYFNSTTLAVILATRTYGRQTNGLFCTSAEMNFIIGNDRKPYYLVRMIPFGEDWEEPHTTMAFPASIMFKLWLPGTGMPDDIVDEITASHASHDPNRTRSASPCPAWSSRCCRASPCARCCTMFRSCFPACPSAASQELAGLSFTRTARGANPAKPR